MKKFEEFDEFDDFGPAPEPVDLKPYVQAVLKNWKRILLWAFCGALVGIIIGFSKPKTYTSTAVVAPELATRSTLSSGAASLASLAGINMNSMALTDAMHPDLYPVVIRSSTFYMGLFDLPLSFTHADTLVQTDLYDYMANYCKTPWYAYVFGFPRICIDAVKSVLLRGDKEEEFEASEGYEHMDSLRLTRQQESVIKALSKSVKASVEKKTYVLSVQVTLQDRVIAAQVANAVVDHLREFVVGYRTKRAMENVAYYEKVYEETHSEYLAAQRAYAYYMDTHQGSLSRSSQVQQQLLQNEAQVRYQIYNSTAQNLLAARAKVQQEAPVLVVVQRAMAPHIGKPSKVKLALLWFILGGFAAVVWVVVREVARNKKRPDALQ